jgi:hypothetical protein
MADNVLTVKVQATIDDLSKALKEAEKEVGDFGKTTEKTFDKAGQSTGSLASGIGKSGTAMRKLDSETKGVSTALIGVGKAATKSGAAMRSALIASGIGAFIVALTLVIEYWDEISEAIFGADESLASYLEGMEDIKAANVLLDQQAKKLSLLSDQYKLLGEGISVVQSLQEANARAELALTNSAISLVQKRFRELKKIYEANKGAGVDEEVLEAIRELDVRMGELQIEALGLENQLIALDQETGEVTITMDKAAESVDKVTKKVSKFQDVFKVGIIKGDFGKQLPFRAMMTEVEQFKSDFEAANPWAAVMDLDKEKLAENKEAITEHFMSIQEIADNFANELANLVAGSISGAFTDLGQSIGEAIANGEDVLGAAGKSILKSLASFIGDLGEMLIYYGTLAVTKGTLDAIIQNSANPYVTIAAGVAAIAVGVALVAASSAFGASIGGSGNQPAVPSTAGASGGGSGGSGGGSRYQSSQNNYNSGGGSGGTYVFEIEGTKLVGVIANTVNRNKALGGSLSIAT